jgi:nucleoside-diphosphate-sugar epimerase
MTRLLVSGASGFVGRALVSELSTRGHEIVALVRRSAGTLSTGVIPLTVEDINLLGDDAATRLRGIDTVVHCAARGHMLTETAADPLAEFRRVNTAGSVALAAAASAAGVKRFVFVSSIGVNGVSSPQRPFRADDVPQPATAYALSKWEAEQALHAVAQRSGMALCIVRPPLVYGRDAPGNFALLVRAVRSGLPLPLGALHAMRSFISIDNLVDLLIVAATRETPVPGTFLAADGEDLSTADFVRAIATALARRPLLLPVPQGLLTALASVAGRADQVRKLAARLQVDSAPTQAALGWSPRWSVAQSLHRALSPHNAGLESDSP